MIMEKKAFVTGISGQDGSYLAELLLENDYTVIGLERRTVCDRQHKMKNISHLLYNLAAQSHVGASFKSPVSTSEINLNGCLNLLETIRLLDPKIKFYQASTSEMFGDNAKCPQNENTHFSPVSPYACAKLAAHHMVGTYRKSYNIFACSGILFNHESPRRGENFVTRKITKAAARIKMGLQDELRLGNLEAQRDWGFAGDYVEVMHKMLHHSEPDDYVVATGETNSVRDFLNYVFDYAELNVEDHVIIDSKFYRPCEVPKLWGDPSKAKRILGWQPKVSFKELAVMMYEQDLKNTMAK